MLSRKQVYILWIGVVLTVAMAILPPWESRPNIRFAMTAPAGYHLIFAPPPMSNVRVDVTRLVIQWITLCVVTGAAMVRYDRGGGHNEADWQGVTGVERRRVERWVMWALASAVLVSWVYPLWATDYYYWIPLSNGLRRVYALAEIQAVWADPQFNKLDLETRREIMNALDPNFTRLPYEDQNEVFARAFSKFSGETSLPSPPQSSGLKVSPEQYFRNKMRAELATAHSASGWRYSRTVRGRAFVLDRKHGDISHASSADGVPVIRSEHVGSWQLRTRFDIGGNLLVMAVFLAIGGGALHVFRKNGRI